MQVDGPAAFDHLFDRLFKIDAVGQLGQRIMVGQELDKVFAAFAVGDIVGDSDEIVQLRVMADAVVEPAYLTVGTFDTKIDSVLGIAGLYRFEKTLNPLPVFRIDHLLPQVGLVEKRLPGDAENGFDGPADIAHLHCAVVDVPDDLMDGIENLFELGTGGTELFIFFIDQRGQFSGIFMRGESGAFQCFVPAVENAEVSDEGEHHRLAVVLDGAYTLYRRDIVAVGMDKYGLLVGAGAAFVDVAHASVKRGVVA